MSDYKFTIYTDRIEEYRYNLKAGNGEIVLSGEGYTSKQNCINGIISVRENAPYDVKYDRKISTNNFYYFNLKAGNGQIIGVSELYSTAFNRNQGIERIKGNAPSARIYE